MHYGAPSPLFVRFIYTAHGFEKNINNFVNLLFLYAMFIEHKKYICNQGFHEIPEILGISCNL